MKKIVICGGHLTPALALIEQFEKEKDVKIYFFGRRHSLEGSKNLSAEIQIMTKKKVEFYQIITGRFQRKFTRHTFISLLKIPVGLIQSLFYLAKIRPSLIVSFGGYLSVPVVFSGWLFGIDSITHEQASVPGLANKINSLFVKRIFLSWSQTQKFFDKNKCQVIGNLIRLSIFNKNIYNQKINNFIKKPRNLIFVTGGNQGSHFLNSLIFESINSLKHFDILHQIGTANYKNDHQKAKGIKRRNYLSVDYIDPKDFGAILKKSTLVISRSGANTVWELAILAKPAILIPLPFSANSEQQRNAQILQSSGQAIVLSQEETTPKMLEESINKILNNLTKYKKSARDFQKTLPQDAAFKLSNYVINQQTS